jgi:hypothetical protein
LTLSFTIYNQSITQGNKTMSNPAFPVNVKYDNFEEETCDNMKELRDSIENAHNNGVFCDSITDANDNEFGVEWKFEIVEL